EMTEPARRAFASKFERDVDPEGVLRGSVGPHHDGVIVTALRLLVRDGVREGCAGVSPKASGGSTIQAETSG
ncbi:MAG TPA: hypothetical protein VIK32_04185, partial [Candidatus Limnocylindrales bacterium]